MGVGLGIRSKSPNQLITICVQKWSWVLFPELTYKFIYVKTVNFSVTFSYWLLAQLFVF